MKMAFPLEKTLNTHSLTLDILSKQIKAKQLKSMLSPETQHNLGLLLVFGGLLPGILMTPIANWAAKKRKLAEKGTPRYTRLLLLEVITTTLVLVAVVVVGGLSFVRIGAI